jgi:hypothetical protein
MKLIPKEPSSWTCPMHPDVITTEPGTCPICGMKLIPEVGGSDASAGHSHTHDTADGAHLEGTSFAVPGRRR